MHGEPREVIVKRKPKLCGTIKRFELFKHDSFKSHPRAKLLRLTLINLLPLGACEHVVIGKEFQAVHSDFYFVEFSFKCNLNSLHCFCLCLCAATLFGFSTHLMLLHILEKEKWLLCVTKPV